MLVTDIKRVIEQVSKDKGIDPAILVNTLEEALKSAARKKFGNKIEIEAQYDEKTGEIEVFQFKEVVEEITEPELQITIEEGRKLDPECEVGDSLGTKMDTATFGRIAAQSAKQVIIQKMKDAEKSAVYANFIDRENEIVNGIVQRVDRGDIIVNLGRTEAVLPVREQVPKETYRRGERIRANILKVLEDTRGPQIILTRTHPNFLINLFKTEVPEINEGIVRIMGAAREAGSRAKIAVGSSDSDIDPVGACVGMKGSRVQNVVQELKGEKIDIISYHIDTAKYVCNALSPAEISRVIIDEENHSMEVIVPDEHLSVAIGKKGQNVRLASKLTGWQLDVKSESKYSKAMKDGYESLMTVPGVSAGIADSLFEKGFVSVEELSTAAVEDLVQVKGITEATAKELIQNAINTKQSDESASDDAAENGDKPEPVDQTALNKEESEGTAGEESDDAVPEESQPSKSDAALADKTDETNRSNTIDSSVPSETGSEESSPADLDEEENASE